MTPQDLRDLADYWEKTKDGKVRQEVREVYKKHGIVLGDTTTYRLGELFIILVLREISGLGITDFIDSIQNFSQGNKEEEK